MKNFFGIVLIFVVVFLMSLLPSIINIKKNNEAAFRQTLVSKAIDNAGEAAALACVSSDGIGYEYSNDKIVFTPDRIANAFATSMCVSYGIPTVKSNIDDIINCIPTIVLATNDGYYIAEWEQLDEAGAFELVWQPKKAYIIDSNPDNSASGIMYAITLDKASAKIINKSNLALTVTDNYALIPYSSEQMLQWVNKAISRDVNAILTRYSEKYNRAETQNFYLSMSDNSKSGINRIEQPTLIVMIRGLNIDNGTPINAAAVNGIEITDKDFIVGWTSNGTKYYSPASNLPAGVLGAKMFKSKSEAARAGYSPYIK